MLSLCFARMDEKSLSVYKIDMAFGMYVMAELNITVPLVYCRMVGARNMPRYNGILEARYLRERVEDMNEIHLALGRWKDLRPHIDQWLVEYSSNMWIDTMKVSIGIAPAYDSVFEKCRALRQEKKLDDIKYDRGDLRKTWVKRFMRKWSSSRTTIATHEADSGADVVTKVARKRRPTARNLVRFWAPFWGTKNGPRIGTTTTTVCN